MQGGVESEIEAHMRALLDAVVRRDRAALELLLADEFAMIVARAPGGRVERGDWIDHNLADDYAITAFRYEDLRVCVYGEATSASGRVWESWTRAGVPGSATFLFTDVWVQRGGRWQLATRHATPLAEG